MTTNELLVLVVIGVVAAAFILRPLLRGSTRPTVPASRESAPATAHPVASEEMAELELDRAMGRVSEADFQRWRVELEEARVVAEASTPDDAASRAEELVRRWREAPRPTCPSCGERPESEARFCSNCGARLTA